MPIDRRSLISGLLAATAAAGGARAAPLADDVRGLYGAVRDGQFSVPAINLSRIGPSFLRARIDYSSREPAGTIVIDPKRHYLYFINGDGTAMRYGVGVGRQGFAWAGTATINSKQEWPDWYPPKEMLERQPELMAKMKDLQSGIGMPGGLHNPLGARALYLWQNNKDTLFRIHGTTEPWTIGTNASSGCIRMINQDAIDLYGRVPLGARVVVLGTGAPGEIAIREEPGARQTRPSRDSGQQQALTSPLAPPPSAPPVPARPPVEREQMFFRESSPWSR